MTHIVPLPGEMWLCSLNENFYIFSALMPPKLIARGHLTYNEKLAIISRGPYLDVWGQPPVSYICADGSLSKNKEDGIVVSQNKDYLCAVLNGETFPAMTTGQEILRKIIETKMGIRFSDGTLGIMNGDSVKILRIADNEIVDPTVSLDGLTIAVAVPREKRIVIIDNPLIGI